MVFTINPSWYSPVQPKPVYENDGAEAYWDVPVYAESTIVKANRIDVRIVDKEKKGSAITGDDMSVDRGQRKIGGRKDDQVCTTKMGTEK